MKVADDISEIQSNLKRRLIMSIVIKKKCGFGNVCSDRPLTNKTLVNEICLKYTQCIQYFKLS